MLAVQGYYDGMTIKPLEQIKAKPNQRVIITIMAKATRKEGKRGALAEYANPALAKRKKGAWARATVENFRKTGDSA